jgi:hypothetical protein
MMATAGEKSSSNWNRQLWQELLDQVAVQHAAYYSLSGQAKERRTAAGRRDMCFCRSLSDGFEIGVILFNIF